MAGHRRLPDGTIKPKRAELAAYWRTQIHQAPTGADQLAEACRWLRSAAHRNPHHLHRLATLVAREADALEKEVAA